MRLLIPRFNSIKVRLRPGHNIDFFVSTTFQFHKGSIKTPISDFMFAILLRFNSIKVRLRHYDADTERSQILFQFHKGSIKT